MRVAVAVSGGVDSAVSALLLKNRGLKVTGVYMRNWSECATSDPMRSSALEICTKLKIPFISLNFEKEYWIQVFAPFLEAIEQGHTPNADINCNSKIKFGAFTSKVISELGVDKVAFGHYAQTITTPNGTSLRKGFIINPAVDATKDQTYFLSQVKSDILDRVLFPVGHLLKSTVKQLAIDNGLHRVAAQRESMGICFIGKNNFGEFVGEYLDKMPGVFVNSKGEILGAYACSKVYTIGQRVRVSGMQTRLFCAQKHSDRIVVVPQGHVLLMARSMIVEFEWATHAPQAGAIYHVKYRYRQDEGLISLS